MHNGQSQENNLHHQELRKLFNECDLDKNGSLTRDEFRELCARIGLSCGEAEEAFQRLDRNGDQRVSFDEFMNGFNQYQSQSETMQLVSQMNPTNQLQSQYRHNEEAQSNLVSEHRSNDHVHSSTSNGHDDNNGTTSNFDNNFHNINHNSTSNCRTNLKLTPSSPRAGHRAISGSVSLRSSVPARFYPNSSNTQTSEDSNPLTISYESAPTSCDQNDANYNTKNINSNSSGNNNNNNLVVYSSDLLPVSISGPCDGSSQYNSLTSNYGASPSGSQIGAQLNVQDLLECVQKLQNENQQLSQIFFKDKRERDELINQLGEEFDEQVRQVEQRAQKKAREEVEAEKIRLREMMMEEREQLQHHYKTIERMSNLVKSAYDERKSKGQYNSLDGAESIDEVKSKLDDTYEENKQLKKSLQDTKTDVALIWREMWKLKKQYEQQLNSAHERNEETKEECDHIKKQLNLMKDSNRKLQDASDVITNYIADKVEPVIKIASIEQQHYQTDLESGSGSGMQRLILPTSATNSRRGSVLSDYLAPNGSSDDDAHDGNRLAVKGPKKIVDGVAQVNQGHYESVHGTSQRTYDCKQSSNAPKIINYDDDIDIENWLASNRDNHDLSLASSSRNGIIDEHLSTSTSPMTNLPVSTFKEPKSVAILKNARDSILIRDTSSSSEGSSTSITNTKELSSKNFPKNKREASILRRTRMYSSNQSRSIDLNSDNEEIADSSTGAKQDKEIVDKENDNCLMVQPADGPPVATFDVILVGDSFVGKSSLASRFIEGTYVKGLISTTSIDFKTKDCKVDGVNYTINLWDTAGQERFRSITASYFRKAKGIILMYDVTEKRSYLNIRNWMSTIENSASESVVVLLLGNKIDMRTQEDAENCVPKAEGERLAQEYGILFLETSVRNGTNLGCSVERLIRFVSSVAEFVFVNNQTIAVDV